MNDSSSSIHDSNLSHLLSIHIPGHSIRQSDRAGLYRENYRTLSDPMGIRQKLSESQRQGAHKKGSDVGECWNDQDPVGTLEDPTSRTSCRNPVVRIQTTSDEFPSDSIG